VNKAKHCRAILQLCGMSTPWRLWSLVGSVSKRYFRAGEALEQGNKDDQRCGMTSVEEGWLGGQELI